MTRLPSFALTLAAVTAATIVSVAGMGIAHDLKAQGAICGKLAKLDRSACEGAYSAWGEAGAREYVAKLQPISTVSCGAFEVTVVPHDRESASDAREAATAIMFAHHCSEASYSYAR